MSDTAYDILAWLGEMGDDTPLADAPIDRFAESEAAKKITAAKRQATAGHPATSGSGNSALKDRVAKLQQNNAQTFAKSAAEARHNAQAILPDENAVQAARDIAQNARTLEDLKAAMDGFQGCNLRLTAKNLVFADGNRNSKLMLIGESPGRDEDLQGLPFVGPSGQLLDRMLAAIGLDRTKVYITNCIPWRPPGNRAPTTIESEICRPFVERHIELIAPNMIMLIGGSSAKTLLKQDEGILRLRGQWKKIEFGEQSIDAIATLHPAYLLRQPAQKRLAWHDLLKLKARLEDQR